jgi:hypothetical protein
MTFASNRPPDAAVGTVRPQKIESPRYLVDQGRRLCPNWNREVDRSWQKRELANSPEILNCESD